MTTLDRIGEFLAKWPASEFGPAHILVSDLNVDNVSLLFCLREAMASLGRKPNDPELTATFVFLLNLSETPEEKREADVYGN
jgi:hypothetical protein